jgi:hypothetical protein
MPIEAPLQVTVEVHFTSGPAAGLRRFRLSRTISLPPLLCFDGDLPLEGEGSGRVLFALPDGQSIESLARLLFDPEHPTRGSQAELLDLAQPTLQIIQSYIEQRMPS